MCIRLWTESFLVFWLRDAGLCVELAFSVCDFCWSFENPEILKNKQDCSFRYILTFKGDYVLTAEKAMAPHSSTLARKTPWTEEPGGLPSMGSHGVRHD